MPSPEHTAPMNPARMTNAQMWQEAQAAAQHGVDDTRTQVGELIDDDGVHQSVDAPTSRALECERFREDAVAALESLSQKADSFAHVVTFMNTHNARVRALIRENSAEHANIDDTVTLVHSPTSSWVALIDARGIIEVVNAAGDKVPEWEI